MKLQLHHINLSSDKVDKMNEFYLKVMNLQTETEGLPILEKNKGYSGDVAFVSDGKIQTHLAEKDLDVCFNTGHSINPLEKGHIAYRTDDLNAFKKHLDKLKIHVKSADQKVEELSGGQRQAIAIARATAFNSKLVIMDEPTAALAIKEVGKVLDLINSLKRLGVSVIIISHGMDDIFAVCDRVMALFQGTNFAESELSKTTRDEVIGWIMGKK